MNNLEQKPETQRHYPIENYRASPPIREWTEQAPSQFELKQRHDAVMARLHKDARQFRRTHRILLSCYGFTGFGYIMGDLLSRPLLHTHRLALDVLYLAGFVAMLGCLGSSYFWKQTTKEMAASADIRDIGAFIDALQNKHADSQATLLRLLPEMRASDGGLLQEPYREILRKLSNSRITTKKRVPLVLAILKAYEQVGGEDDIPVVEKLAAGSGYGKYKNVRLAAEECLPAMRIVAPRHRAQVSLLRASSANESNPVDLVRAIGAKSEVKPDELLRAATSELAQP